MCARLAWAEIKSRLIETEGDLYADLDINRPSILHGRLKAPLLNSLDCFCIQSETQTSNHVDVPRMARRVHNQAKDARPLRLSLARFFRVLRIRCGDGFGCRDTSADVINTAANAASAPCSYARPVANADSPS